MKRTGSTWQYNAVRLILSASGATVYGTGYSEWDPDADAEWHVIKTHAYYNNLRVASTCIFTSHRPFDHVKASAFRAFKSEFTPEREESWLSWDRKWSRFSCYKMEFDEIYRNPIGVISIIADRLRVSIDAGLIADELLKIVPPTDRDYDPETFLFKNHITKEWTP